LLKTLLQYLRWDANHVPMSKCLVPFIIGIGVSVFVSYSLYVLAIVSMGLSLALFFVGMNVYNKTVNLLSDIILVISFLLFGISYGQLRRHVGAITDYGDNCYVSGYVYDVYRQADDDLRFVINADTLITEHHRFYNVRGLVSFDSDSLHFVSGDRIVANGSLRYAHGSVFSSFDYESYLYDKNIQFEASASSCVTQGSSELSYSYMMGHVRQFVYDRLLASGVDSVNVDFLMALVVGDRSRLPQSLKTEFSDSGLIHIIAVSGLHIGIIYYLLTLIFSRFTERRRWYHSLFVMVILFLYAAVCGLSPSAIRAVVMMSIIELAYLIKREHNPLSTLCCAAFVVLVIDPYNIYSVGFWLSFSAVWGLMAFYPFLMSICPFKNKYVKLYLYSSACVAIIAQMATLPVSLLSFHRFPTYFLINNLLIVDFIYPIIGLSILSIILASIVPIGICLNYALYIVNNVISFSVSLPLSTIPNIPFSLCDCLLLIISLYALSWLFKSKIEVFGREFSRRHMYMLCALLWSLFFASCTFTMFSSLNRKSLVVYETWKNIGISHVNGRHSTHFLTDTLKTAPSCRFDKLVYATSSETHLLMSGMSVAFDDINVSLVSSFDTAYVHSSGIVVVVDDIEPFGSSFDNVVLTSRTKYRKEWVDYCQKNNIPYSDASISPVWFDLK